MNRIFFKILVKNGFNDYDDIVSRPFNRALVKMENPNFHSLMASNGCYLYGYVENNEIYELFTQKRLYIHIADMQFVTEDEIWYLISALEKEDIKKLQMLIKKIIFDEDIDIDFIEISTQEELAYDRYLQLGEYHDGYTNISSYDSEHVSDYHKFLVNRYIK